MEVELKLWFSEALSDDLLARINSCLLQLAVQVQQFEPTQLLNAYFETPDQWFRRHDSGLRSRLKKGRFEQTIKLAGQQQGAAHIRPEYNVPCDSVLPVLAAFPGHIWPQGTDVNALQQQLTEMFRTDFIRRAWLLTLADGTVVEAVLDQGEVKAGDQTQPILELELELCSGNALQLFQLAKTFCQQLPLSLGFQSKAERGYRLAQAEPLSWQQATAEMPLSQQLRLLLQNLWLSVQNNSAPNSGQAAAALQQQWLLLQTSLAEISTAGANPQLLPLLNTAPAHAVAGPAMTLWLLQLSAVLLDISEVKHD
jgi:triphosphatase